MAASQITPDALIRNTGVTVTAVTATSSGYYIDVSGLSDQTLFVLCEPGATCGDWTITVEAGTQYLASDIGDISVTAKATAYKWLCFDMSRVKDSNKYITFNASCTGGAITGYVKAGYISY